jgi:predicted permease
VVRSADPGYFQAMGIPLKRGRVFTAEDRLEAGSKSVITESMAATFFPNEDPIGKRLRLGRESIFEIVGVVGDTRQNLPLAPEPTMYFPFLRGTVNFATVMVRASGDPNLLSLPIQKEMRSLDPDLPAVTVRTMDEMMWGQTQQNRFGLTLIGLFAGLAVILAAIGLYGVLAYSMRQRTNELGIRMALGAGPSDITRLVVWQGLKPAVAGIVAGLAGAAAGARVIQSILFDVKGTDPVVLTGVVMLLGAISAGACFVPAWRATRIDPVVALRTE